MFQLRWHDLRLDLLLLRLFLCADLFFDFAFHWKIILTLLSFSKYLLKSIQRDQFSGFFYLSCILDDILNRFECQQHFLVMGPALILCFASNKIGHFDEFSAFLLLFVIHLPNVGFEVSGIKNIFWNSPFFGIDLTFLWGFGLYILRWGILSVGIKRWKLIFWVHFQTIHL
mgnify:FL=1